MFPDEVNHSGWQAIAFGKGDPISDVLDDGRSSNFRGDIIVGIHTAAHLIFDEKTRVLGFSNVVVECTNPDKKPVRSDGFSSLFCQV